eukprot:365470-Chlamydomonas_euryale.AAC.8
MMCRLLALAPADVLAVGHAPRQLSGPGGLHAAMRGKGRDAACGAMGHRMRSQTSCPVYKVPLQANGWSSA